MKKEFQPDPRETRILVFLMAAAAEMQSRLDDSPDGDESDLTYACEHLVRVTELHASHFSEWQLEEGEVERLVKAVREHLAELTVEADVPLVVRMA